MPGPTTAPNVPEFPSEAFDQVCALVELCNGRELEVELQSGTAELEFHAREEAEVPSEEELSKGQLLLTEQKPAELFGEESERYVLVCRAGPFRLRRGWRRRAGPIAVGETLRLDLEVEPGARDVYSIQTLEAAEHR